MTMHSRNSTDPVSVIKYADMMAKCTKQPWAVYNNPGNTLAAMPYRGARNRLIEVCHP